ncbi:MAG: sulfatase-like hydrolase/transferase [Chloroflexi bacterium]|nr:sulfatase-like hydrolase/transferase [Chloroflexota bacterium]
MVKRPKNVLILWSDQQRADTIGAYGNRAIETPALDRLAAGGALFEQAYCPQPVCSPTRASVLTGLYPHTHGVRRCNMVLSPAVPTLAELLRAQGYAGGYAGKWHLGHELEPQRGFDDFWAGTEDLYTHYDATEGTSAYYQFLVSRGYVPRDRSRLGFPIFNRDTAARLPEEAGKPAFIAQECVRFLETYRDRPFILSANFLEPHMPFFGPFDEMYSPDEITLPPSWYGEMEETVPRHYRLLRREYATRNPYVKSNDEWGWKELTARYWGLCSLVDKYVGQILRRLDALGLAEDTIVVYTSDHGDMMGQLRMVTKSVQFEGAARVPLLIRHPDLPPCRLATPVSLVDLTPTLLDLLGQPIPAHMQGHSVARLLHGGDVAPDEAEIFVEWNEWDGIRQVWNPEQGIADPRETAPPSIDARTIRRGRWKMSLYATGESELYDLVADPEETHNAIGDRDNAAVVAALYDRLRRWQHETGDTLALPDPRG